MTTRTVVVVLAAGFIPAVLSLLLFRGRGLVRDTLTAEAHCYYPHRLITWLAATGCVLGGALFATIALKAPKPDVWSWLIFLGLASFFLAAGVVLVAQLRSAYVLTRDMLEFRYGQHIRRVSVADISSVHLRSGYIVVLKGPRRIGMMIPPVFAGSGDLARRLSTHVAAAKASSHQIGTK